MTDFYSVLQRAVSSLPDSSGPNRRAVYDKARKALLKQLQSFDPPLPSSDVTAQRLALEDAIRKIENEIARQIRTQRALQGVVPPGGAGARRSLSGPRQGAATAAGSDAAAAARLAEEERAARRAAEAERARKEHAELLQNAISEATVTSDDPAPVEAERETLRTPPVPVRATPMPPPDERHPEDADMFEADADYDRVAREPEVPDGIVEGEYDEIDDVHDLRETGEEGVYEEPDEAAAAQEDRDAEKKRRKADARERKEEERRLRAERRTTKKAPKRNVPVPVAERRQRSSGKALRRIGIALVLLLLCGGAGYAVYTQGGALIATLDSLRDDPEARPPITVTGRTVEKNADRLPSTLDGEETRSVTTTPWPPRGADGTEGADAPVEAQPAVPPADRTVGEDIRSFAPDPAPDASQEQVSALGEEAGESAAAETPEATAETVPAPEVSSAPITEFTAAGTQQAVLYEEAAQAGEPGGAVPGGVEWSMVRQSIGGGDPEPVIKATAEIPDRQMTATVTVRKNEDGALPASHLIEIEFNLPEGFEGGVKNVPGLIMKQDEQARGDALRGAAARVSSGLFWIALSENAADRDSNLALLRDRDWIDIPILFESGRRAILTLRKGDDGFQSVDAAIRAWSAG